MCQKLLFVTVLIVSTWIGLAKSLMCFVCGVKNDPCPQPFYKKDVKVVICPAEYHCVKKIMFEGQLVRTCENITALSCLEDNRCIPCNTDICNGESEITEKFRLPTDDLETDRSLGCNIYQPVYNLLLIIFVMDCLSILF